jgi:hypothetical protein
MENQAQPVPDFLSFTESSKILIEYVKHIMTLASGSIVLLATFGDKLSRETGKGFISWAFVCLIASIVICMVFVIQLLVYATKLEKRTLPNERSLTRVLVFGFTSFIIGLVLIGMFTSLNF